ncbi:MAG: hypothetical protein CK547_04625 [Chitinophagaceae bacterium]|nr:MAG: hypothetical protein CK547_04625 [Chitinophagaceae bacterium]
MTYRLLLIGFFSLIVQISIGQDNSLLTQAKLADKKLKTEEALKLYQQYLLDDSSNLEVLVRCAELTLYLGNAEPKDDQKQPFYNTAFNYAHSAYHIDSLTAPSNYIMGLVLSALMNGRPIKEKLVGTKDIWGFANKAIQVNPNDPKSLHLLGKWHDELSSLNPAAKAGLKLFSKDIPKASITDAIDLYEKARTFDPALIVNNVDLAIAFKKIGRADLSISILTTTIKLVPSSIEEQWYKNKAKELLESMK